MQTVEHPDGKRITTFSVTLEPLQSKTIYFDKPFTQIPCIGIVGLVFHSVEPTHITLCNPQEKLVEVEVTATNFSMTTAIEQNQQEALQ